MKNTVQASPNGGIKSPSVQPQKRRAKKAEDAKPTLGICAHFELRGKRRTKSLMRDMGITVEEWEQACRADIRMKKNGQGNFFGNAIREKLADLENQRKQIDWEEPAQKAMGLIHLLISKIVAEAGGQTYASLEGFNPKISAEICGLQAFAFDVEKQLLAGVYGGRITTEVVS